MLLGLLAYAAFFVFLTVIAPFLLMVATPEKTAKLHRKLAYYTTVVVLIFVLVGLFLTGTILLAI